ncbi:AI-2E family transporter [Candidatus Woesearchaeota archaeon]|nr:AI-2E family transporter [Candidatus Woesearchaeota archaeon]
MASDRKDKKVYATALAIGMAVFLVYALWQFVSAFLGALVLYSLFLPLYRKFSGKFGVRKGLSAVIVILLILAIIILPLTVAASLLVGEASKFVANAPNYADIIQSVSQLAPNLNLESKVQELLISTGQYLKNLFVSAIQSAAKFIIDVIIMFFALYYLFLNSDRLSELAYKFMPFSRKNVATLLGEFHRITNSTIISTGLIALIQGVLLGLGFFVLGIEGALFWGFIAAVFAFLPVIGISLIWIPAGLIQLLVIHNATAGIGIIVWGLILSNVDSFLRPIIQQKVGKVHPLTSLVGVFMGLSLFGITGIIIGPLIISYSVHIIRMFNEEYVE